MTGFDIGFGMKNVQGIRHFEKEVITMATVVSLDYSKYSNEQILESALFELNDGIKMEIALVASSVEDEATSTPTPDTVTFKLSSGDDLDPVSVSGSFDAENIVGVMRVLNTFRKQLDQ